MFVDNITCNELREIDDYKKCLSLENGEENALDDVYVYVAYFGLIKYLKEISLE